VLDWEEDTLLISLSIIIIIAFSSPWRPGCAICRISSVRKRAETTLNNIKGLIGYFDLDPARALDVILDVFTDNILYHHVFFRELLQLSPWAPRRRKTDETNGNHSGLPDGGFQPIQEGANTVCAQILGFKFAWYTVNGAPLIELLGSPAAYDLLVSQDIRRICRDTI
jgi:hypothetical protein